MKPQVDMPAPYTPLNLSCKICKMWAKLNPDSKAHGANMGPIWGRQDPGGPHVGPMNFAIWESNHLFSWC